jgi:serine/threonine protein kinase
LDEFVFLVLEKCDSSGWEYVNQTFNALFKEYGLPKQML